MKILIVTLCTLLSLALISCKEKKTTDENQKGTNVIAWTEEEKWKYFQDSIAHKWHSQRHRPQDSLNDFEIFSRVMFADLNAKNKTDPYIYAFEEHYIDTTTIDTNKFWFRIVVTPSFRNPYCIVIEKKNRRTYITAKMTDGDGRGLTGLLLFAVTNTLPDSVYNDISASLRKLDFWNLDIDTTCSDGFDGETWTFEAIENGQYNIINRWGPLHCGSKTTIQLAQLGTKITGLSKMLDVMAMTYKVDKKRLETAFYH